MAQGHDRVSQEHPGANGPHHFTDLLPHTRFITVDLTLATGCFAFLKRTMSKTFLGVAQEFSTIRTEVFAAAVVYPTILPNHHRDCIGFTLYPA